jgi:hypothetical protein
MKIKLAFSHTSFGLFKITAASIERKHQPQPIIALYRDESVFLALLLDAKVDPETHAQIVTSVAAAATGPSSAACCEDVDLTTQQLELLHLESVLSQLR